MIYHQSAQMLYETRKIWGDGDVNIMATCVRVPVMRAHAEAINLEFSRDISEEEALSLLSKAKGVSIINDRAANRFPMPLDATDKVDWQPPLLFPPRWFFLASGGAATKLKCRADPPLVKKKRLKQDDVYVGRVRRDISLPGSRGLSIFVCGDQIRKGAALNAVQIAELLL